MKGRDRNKAFLLLFIPLLFSTISTFLVYSGHFSNYYAKYENLLETTFPDYAIVLEDNLILLEPEFNVESFLTSFELKEVTYVGKLRCNLSFNSNNFEIVLYWAPEEFFVQHSKAKGEKDKILLDRSFISLDDLEINQNVSFNFSSENNQVETNLSISNFVSVEDVFTDELLQYGWVEPFHELNLFLTSETFYEIFEEFIEGITTVYAPLFEFSEKFLKSHPPHQMIDNLEEKKQELDYYFDYSYNPANHEEEMIRQYSLERELHYFTSNYREYTLSRVILFYVISFSFCYIVMNFTTQEYIKSQKERIRISYLRGSKRSNLLLNFTGLESRTTLLSIFLGFFASIVILAVFTPSLLRFTYYYGMNLLIVFLIAVFYGSIQLITLTNQLKQLYRIDDKESEYIIGKIFSFSGKTVPWILFNILIGFSFFLLFFTGIVKFEFDSTIYLIVISVLVTLILNIMIWKKTIFKIGRKVVNFSTILSKLSKQTIKLARKFIYSSYRIIQLLILLIMICTFFLSSFDTIKNLNLCNNELNQIGEIILSFHPEKENIVEANLSNLVDHSVEIRSSTTLLDSITLEESEGISRLVDIYYINSSKIQTLFSSISIREKYKGNFDAQVIANELETDLNSVVINNALAQLLSIQLHSTFNLPIPIELNPYIESRTNYRVTAIDTVSFIPFFSGRSLERPFTILNDRIISNTTNIKVNEIYQIVWLKETIALETFRKSIQALNENSNSQIEIVDQFEFPIITDDYWIPAIFQQFMFSLFTLFVVCLFFFFLAFYSDTINQQMKGFRIFFARGLSFKKGIMLAMLPLFLFTLFYIILSYVVGLILSFVMFSSIQPKYYLRIPFSILPFSLTFLSSLILLLGAILLVSGISSYRKLRKRIPEVKFNIPSVFQNEEGFI
jgi:hypothetical protein